MAEPDKHIYLPTDPDPLRDGLYKGYYAHLVPPQEPPKNDRVASTVPRDGH